MNFYEELLAALIYLLVLLGAPPLVLSLERAS